MRAGAVASPSIERPIGSKLSRNFWGRGERILVDVEVVARQVGNFQIARSRVRTPLLLHSGRWWVPGRGGRAEQRVKMIR